MTKILSALVCLALGSVASAAGAPVPRLNVLFIATDETRNLADLPARAADVAAGAAELEKFHPIVRPGWTPVLPTAKL